MVGMARDIDSHQRAKPMRAVPTVARLQRGITAIRQEAPRKPVMLQIINHCMLELRICAKPCQRRDTSPTQRKPAKAKHPHSPPDIADIRVYLPRPGGARRLDSVAFGQVAPQAARQILVETCAFGGKFGSCGVATWA